MARFLSQEWFSEVGAAGANPVIPAGPRDAGSGAPPSVEVVVEQVVEGGPDGPVVYRIHATASGARIAWPVSSDAAPPDLRIRTDWDTAVAVARGEMSTHRALLDGLLKVSGDPTRFGETAAALSGADPVPIAVRATTTWS